jgi:hypothetical protein
MPKYIIKHINRKDSIIPSQKVETKPVVEKESDVKVYEVEKPKNNTEKKKAMKQSSITNIENLVSQMGPEQTTKRIKKDKGLIERMESEKIMITEDNRQLLND